MAFSIERIQSYTSTSGVFFFDSNIWLKVIAPKIRKEKNSSIKYVNFFEKVYKDKGGKIAVNKLLFSELINTYMKVVALKSYIVETGIAVPSNEFKTKYRPTQHYKDQYEIICDDIFSYSESFVFYDFPDENIDIEEAASLPKLDFNDYCYFKTVVENNITLVTDDSDFFIEGAKVLTLNNNLYNEKFLTVRVPS